MNRFLKTLLSTLVVLSLNLQGLSTVRAAGVEVVSVSASPVLPLLPITSGMTSRGVDPAPTPETKPEGKPEAKPDLWVEPEAWTLNVDVKFYVNARLEDLLEQGVPLHFITEVELYRPRWYWKDELVMRTSQSVRLTYQAITRQYRVSRGPLELKTSYEVAVRYRLDKSQLPKPFQITMLTDSDWVPVSEWKLFSFTPQLIKIAP
jgi:Domain of unknown function (DUF4390)